MFDVVLCSFVSSCRPRCVFVSPGGPVGCLEKLVEGEKKRCYIGVNLK